MLDGRLRKYEGGRKREMKYIVNYEKIQLSSVVMGRNKPSWLDMLWLRRWSK